MLFDECPTIMRAREAHGESVSERLPAAQMNR